MGKMRACSDSLDIVFYINGARHQPDHASDLTLSLNEYLRQRTSLKGTKLACGEGGCGACAVSITSYDPSTDATRATSINSCLCLVGSLDGHSITTVEGLGNSAAGFHKVQEAFASHHASQCGYCTPGFVVATHAALERCRAKGVPATPELLMQGLDGNLCRCTGYRPILDACRSLVADADVEDLCSKSSGCSMGGTCAHANSHCGNMQRNTFPEDLKQHVKRKASAAQDCAQLGHVPGLCSFDKRIWKAPLSVRELLEDLDNNQGKSVRLLAGNTGYGIYKDWPDEDVIINVNAIPNLHNLQRTQDGLEVGATATIEQLIQALQEDESASAWQQAAKHLLRIAGSHVRAAASIGGHLALYRAKHLQSNLLPVLMALNAQVGVATLTSTRWLGFSEFLDEDVELGLGVSALVTGVRIPAAKEGLWLWAHKVSRRYYNSHAIVDVTVSAVFDPPLQQGEPTSDTKITEAKIVVSTPTVIAKGTQECPGSNCGPDRVEWRSMRCGSAEVALTGQLLRAETLVEALEQLQHDVSPASDQDADEEGYRGIAEGLLLQALGPLVAAASCPADGRLHSLLAAHNLGLPGVPGGAQSVPDYSHVAPPVHSPVEKDRVRLQASGEALYTSDMGCGKGEMYAYPVLSTQALATLVSVDASKVLEEPGVVAFITAEDVPGENRVKGGATDGLLLAEGKVEYVGQPIALIVATTQRTAEDAARRVSVQYGHPKELGAPVLTIPDAIAADSFYPAPGEPSFVAGTHPGRIRVGDPDAAMAGAPNRITGARYTLPSQSHFYMETQNAVAEPGEDGTMRVWSSTQTMDGVQSAVARVLAVPAHSVEVVVRRLGGAYGGKVARSMPVAAAAALAARVTGRCTKLTLNRNDDMRMNGGRSETMLEYDVGFDDKGKVAALKIRGYFLCGAEMNLGFNDMAVLAMAADQAYDFTAMDLDLKLVRTNLAPRTIVRAPGFTNSVMIIEQVMEHVASHLGADPVRVRQLNFLPKYPFPIPPSASVRPTLAATPSSPLPPNGKQPASGKQLTFGGCGRMSAWNEPPERRVMYTSLGRCFQAELFTLPAIWEELQKSANYAQRLSDIHDFNATSPWRKRGIALLPCRFDAAPQPITSAVSIYFDGSVLVIPGGIEMGQGLHTKIKQVAAYQLGLLLPKEQQPLPMSLFRIGDSSSHIVPNGGPSWSSTSSESAVAAVTVACEQLVANLMPHLQVGTSAEETWKGTVASVHADIGYAPAQAMLSAYGFYDGTIRDDICAPHTTGKASLGAGVGAYPLAYCTFGAACTEVELDALTGEQRILRADILFDCGRSMNPALDMGQVEGAFVMGLGLHTSEEVIIDSDTGRLVTDGTWEYKIPAASCIPQQLNVTFLKDSPNRRGVLGSKACGEPSLLLAVSVLHALRMAANAARSDPARRKAERVLALAGGEGRAGGVPPTACRSGTLPVSLKGSRLLAPTPAPSAAAQEPGMQDGFLTMAGPATVGRLKAACGSFTAAQIIKAHLPDHKAPASEPDGWVLLPKGVL